MIPQLWCSQICVTQSGCSALCWWFSVSGWACMPTCQDLHSELYEANTRSVHSASRRVPEVLTHGLVRGSTSWPWCSQVFSAGLTPLSFQDLWLVCVVVLGIRTHDRFARQVFEDTEQSLPASSLLFLSSSLTHQKPPVYRLCAGLQGAENKGDTVPASKECR